MVSPPSPL
ncbi:hypothetical protein ECTW14313_5736, partial [Escherichia coli O157:H7 str. TW14313]